MTYKVDREVAMSKQDAAKGNFLSIPGGLQSMVSEIIQIKLVQVRLLKFQELSYIKS